MRVCIKCKESLELKMFSLTYPRKIASGGTRRYHLKTCRKCVGKRAKELYTEEQRVRNNNKKKEARRVRKARAIKYKGDICVICKRSVHISAFDFHHTNPDEKVCDPGLMMQLPDEVLFKELDKCILICANCHRELHYEQGNLGEIKARRKKTNSNTSVNR